MKSSDNLGHHSFLATLCNLPCSPRRNPLPSLLAWLFLLTGLLILGGCGGGGGGYGSATVSSSGVTTGTTYTGPGTAMGTVSGFGSVVVDGKEYQETPATIYRSEAHGAPAAIASDRIQLGQHVVVSFDANGNITLVDVIPEVEGIVTSTAATVPTGTGGVTAVMPAITVAGVLVVANADPTQGPVTNFGGGYTSLSSVQMGDVIEVHGLLRSANGIDYVQATFIGKQPSFLGTRITGVVANYSVTANTFTVGTAPSVLTIAATGATVLPSGSTLSNGEVVSVWSSGTISGNMLTANVINIRSGLGISGEILSVSGPVASYVSQSNFIVNGVTVDASAVTLPMGTSALANGMDVVATGMVNASGTLVASELRIVGAQSDTTPPVQLTGDITDFVSASNFMVRGVVVDASQNPTFNSGFSAANLQDGAYVKITGTLTNNVVVATAVEFTSMHGTPMLDLKATVQSYNSASGALAISLTLPGSGGQASTVTVTLGSSVTYDNGSVSMLTNGQKIRIHAIYDATTNTFTIETITFEPSPSMEGNDDDMPNTTVLQGMVTAVNVSGSSTTSFTVHGATVVIGSAKVENVPGMMGNLAVGDFVVVIAQTTTTKDTVNALDILIAPAPTEMDNDD